jgi:hypothetical protein
MFIHSQPQKRSRYSDLLPGRLRGRSSSPGRVKNFHFSTSSRTTLGLTQPRIQWVLGVLSLGIKGQGVKLTTHLQLVSGDQENMAIYIDSLTRLHGVVLS